MNPAEKGAAVLLTGILGATPLHEARAQLPREQARQAMYNEAIDVLGPGGAQMLFMHRGYPTPDDSLTFDVYTDNFMATQLEIPFLGADYNNPPDGETANKIQLGEEGWAHWIWMPASIVDTLHLRQAFAESLGKWLPSQSVDDVVVGDQQGILLSNHPNPFPHQTQIRYDIPESIELQAVPVNIGIYDTQGRLVSTLVDRTHYGGGTFSTGWDGAGSDGKPVSPGVYYCRFKAGDVVLNRKMVLTR
ncbi:MAG: hypothetical protein KJ709_05330 [Nanoarchaeota archaeon]|nr:hypothetical protein [Nanoarchaeota archaeon]